MSEAPDEPPGISLMDKAYFQIKKQIMENILPAGFDLDDDGIAAELGMSRTPVRDAIRLLHRQGFVEVIPRKATRVAFLNIGDVRHVYQLITALEVQAVTLLASLPDREESVHALRAAVDDMIAVESGDLGSWHRADERFHRTLLTACGNPRIAAVGLENRDYVQRAHLVALRLRAVTKRSTQVHGDLVELIAQGNVQKAVANHLGQRNRMENDLIGAVERAGLKLL